MTKRTFTRSPCRCGTCYPCDLFARHPERFAGYVAPEPEAVAAPDPEPAPPTAAPKKPCGCGGCGKCKDSPANEDTPG